MLAVKMYVFLHHNIYKWVILCVQVSPFTARGLKAAFVSAEDCDREVIKGIHGREYQLVLISPESNNYQQSVLERDAMNTGVPAKSCGLSC